MIPHNEVKMQEFLEKYNDMVLSKLEAEKTKAFDEKV